MFFQPSPRAEPEKPREENEPADTAGPEPERFRWQKPEAKPTSTTEPLQKTFVVEAPTPGGGTTRASLARSTCE